MHDIHPLIDVVSNDPSSFPPKFLIETAGNLNANFRPCVKKADKTNQVAPSRKTGWSKIEQRGR
jgi:hypothetical protein